GCNDLGRAYQAGLGGLPIDLPRAADLYKRACEAQNLVACTNLGSLYVSFQKTFPNDIGHALPLFERACEGKLSRGCFMVGRVYGLGQGVPKDEPKTTDYM